MKSLSLIILTIAVSAVLMGCGTPAGNTNSTGVTNSNAKTAASQVGMPTVEMLKDLETKAFEAYKNKDGKFFESFLPERFVISESGGRLDKAAAIRMIAGHNCDIKDFSFSDETHTNVGADTAVLTMRVAVDGTCDGQKMPSPFIAGTLYVRSGNEWKAAWHGEVPVVDPKAAATPANSKVAGGKTLMQSATSELDPDDKAAVETETRELASIEKAVWEAWMKRDGKMLEDLTARELAFVNIFGGYFVNRADTLKIWTENPCEINSVNVADASMVRVTADTSILIHKGTANGTCFGQKVGPVLGTSIYVREAGKWKLAFTMNMPAA